MTDSFKVKHPVIVVLALWVCGLCGAAQFAKISVIFPELREHYAGAGAELGLLVSLIGFLGIALGLFAGLIVSRIGFRRMLISALLLGSAVSIYQATLPSLFPMLASRLIEGISHLVIVVAAPTLIAQIASSKYRSLAMTLWSTFFGVAYAIVASIGITLVQAHGLGSLFLGHGLVMLASAAVLALLLPGTRLVQSDQGKFGLVEILSRHRQVYSSPFIVAPAAGWLFYTFSFVALLTILPEYVSPENRAFVAGAMPLASTAGSLITGALILPRMSAVKAIILGFGLALCTVPTFWLVNDMTWIGIMLFGFLGIVQGASFASIPQLNEKPENQAQSNGALAQMGNLGNTSGTPIALLIISFAGFHGLIWALLLCYICAIGIHLLMAQRRKKAAGTT